VSRSGSVDRDTKRLSVRTYHVLFIFGRSQESNPTRGRVKEASATFRSFPSFARSPRRPSPGIYKCGLRKTYIVVNCDRDSRAGADRLLGAVKGIVGRVFFRRHRILDREVEEYMIREPGCLFHDESDGDRRRLHGRPARRSTLYMVVRRSSFMPPGPKSIGAQRPKAVRIAAAFLTITPYVQAPRWPVTRTIVCRLPCFVFLLQITRPPQPIIYEVFVSLCCSSWSFASLLLLLP
jgi:hypothetical protein